MTLSNPSKRNGAYILIDQLIQHGVEHIFGYPGGAILPIYDELFFWEKEGLIKHILVRHEQSAAHAADAYSRSSQKVGVCWATSGPGATNLVTGIATARMDSIPLVIITGQVTRSFIGTDAFQETDIFGITLPIVKHSYTVRDTSLLPQIIAEAFYLAQNGRPGPVLIDIPKDVGLEEVDSYSYSKIKELAVYTKDRTSHYLPKGVFQKFFSFLSQSYQPLFYVGGGALHSGAWKIIQQLAKIYQIPVTTTLMGKGIINENDTLSLGMLGMHGTAYANFAVSECDLLLALGARFDDRVTGKLDEFATNAEVIHLDIDPAEVSKNRCPQLSFLGDVKKSLQEAFRFLRKKPDIEINQTKNWLKRITKWKELYPIRTQNYRSNFFSPQEAIDEIGKLFPTAYFTTDVGQHQMWSAQLINCQPKKWISSSGLGTMGFGLPAAIGAKVAHPEAFVVCISGDSSFQMSLQELGTIAQYQLAIKIVIINNGWQGMVRQWQESFYGNRFSNSYMKNGMPNFGSLANAYGLDGFQIHSFQDFLNMTPSFSSFKQPVVVNIEVTENENCYPMVAPGRSNSQMLGLEKPAIVIKK
jgi:acetolactate synthase I/II/III large subunit